ncbi:cornifelin homolog [Conger conger]|uniref:cornifelin homolog n=1 Tax=Conger conger TaxID=82655 RepID=UPI002A59AD9C|nr:cornifelin homolog [Conger conger]
MATNVVMQQSQVPSVWAGQSNGWNTGICACFDDMSICCLGFWCPCILPCKTSADFGECCCLPLLDSMCTIPMCVPPVALAMRVGARNRYNIQGSMCTDCFTATFCNTCTWCQIAREIKQRKRNMIVVNAQPSVTAPLVINSAAMPPGAPGAPVFANYSVR